MGLTHTGAEEAVLAEVAAGDGGAGAAASAGSAARACRSVSTRSRSGSGGLPLESMLLVRSSVTGQKARRQRCNEQYLFGLKQRTEKESEEERERYCPGSVLEGVTGVVVDLAEGDEHADTHGENTRDEETQMWVQISHQLEPNRNLPLFHFVCENTGSEEALTQATDQSVVYQCDRMELWSLCVMILFIPLIQIGKAQESPKAVVTIKPDKHVFRGETVTLRCEIQGGGDTEWTYSWYKNDEELYREHKTQEFSLSSVRNEESGNYTCRGWRSSDTQSSEISDAVTLTVSDVAETVVSVSPSSWLTEGNSVTLSCEVKHSSTGWTFSWYSDASYRDIRGFIRYNRELLSDSSRGSGGSYTLSPVTLNHTGVYECRAEREVFHTEYSKLQPLWITGESPPVSLIISPSRTQHFTADSLSLSCEDQSDSTGWTVRGFTHIEMLFYCSSVSGSKCNITSLSTSHTGVYWCQSESGGRSNPVNITVYSQSHAEASMSVLRLISSLVTVSVYLLLTIIVAVKCFRARDG